MKRVLQAAAVAVLAVLIGLLGWQLWRGNPGADFVEAVGKGERPAAPSFALPRLRGEGDVALASLNGKPSVLNFWASWCDPCAEEAPELNRLAGEWGRRGVNFVGIDAQDARPEARAFATRHGVTYPLLHDTGGTMKSYGVTGFPETFVLDPSGRAIAHFKGPLTDEESLARFEAAVREAGARQ